MRLRYNPDAEFELHESTYVIENFPYELKKSDTLELGMGKGDMITKLAKKHPNKLFIGVEKNVTAAHYAMKKARELKLKNFRIILADVKELPELLTGVVSTIWLTFSDPWPKDRHEKRRLTYRSFLKIYQNLLTENGKVKFKTDNDKLYKYSLESFAARNWKISNATKDFHKHKASKGNIMTGYEKKWSEKGKNINYLEATKNR